MTLTVNTNLPSLTELAVCRSQDAILSEKYTVSTFFAIEKHMVPNLALP